MEMAHWSEVTKNFNVLDAENQQVSQYINMRFIRTKMLPALVQHDPTAVCFNCSGQLSLQLVV